MIDYIYDKEAYPNFFSCTFTPLDSDKHIVFEISERKNQLLEFVNYIQYLQSIDARLIGFMNLGYDYPMLHFIMNNYNNGLTYAHIYDKSSSIINTPWHDRFSNTIWESEWIIDQVDLYKIHHFDNVNKSASLKKLEFQMHSHNIEDLPFPPGTWLTFDQMDVVIAYNAVDNVETKKFYYETIKLLDFRAKLSKRLGKNFTNHSDKKIGSDYFIMKLEEALPGSCFYRDTNGKKQKRQTFRSELILADAVFPYIKFEQPEFTRILEFFKTQTITETKGVFDDLSCVVDGLEYVFGTGGLHATIDPAIVKSNDEYAIIDIDVASYYPNLAIVNRLYPEHLSDAFCEIYQQLYDERKSHAKGTPENQMLKLALNGVYGDSNSEYSPFFDSLYTMKITINGQLLLCMLAEQMIKIPNLTILQANTDGLTVHVPRIYTSHVDALCRWWESFTRLTLEEVEYNRMFIRDGNAYIGEYLDGTMKHKGAYQVDHPRDRKPLGWHQDTSALVVAKAAEAALVRGEDIREFIMSHTDIFDFMLFAKIPRSSSLVIKDDKGVDKPLENAQRYHVSLNGGELVKIMPPLPKTLAVDPNAPPRRFGVCKGFKVTPCNNIQHANPTIINYEWYVQEARKLVDPLIKGTQL